MTLKSRAPLLVKFEIRRRRERTTDQTTPTHSLNLGLHEGGMEDHTAIEIGRDTDRQVLKVEVEAEVEVEVGVVVDAYGVAAEATQGNAPLITGVLQAEK